MTILNEIKPGKECGRNYSETISIKTLALLFLKVEKLHSNVAFYHFSAAIRNLACKLKVIKFYINFYLPFDFISADCIWSA